MSYFDHALFGILAETLPTNQAELLATFVDNNDVLGLIGMQVDRHSDIDFADVLLRELFRKVDDAPLGINTEKVALDSFHEVEASNAITNDRIRNLRKFMAIDIGSKLSVNIRRIKSQLALLLGPCPDSLEPVMTFGSAIGNGRSLKRNTSVIGRFETPTVTVECLELLRSMGEIRSDYKSSKWPLSENAPSIFGSRHDNFIIVEGTVVKTIPKNALTDRVFAPEAVVNIAYQRGAGLAIKAGLLRFGIDLNTLASLHKYLAKKGSIDGHLATIDLQNASDRITCELARLLLPKDWFEMLNALRSQRRIVAGGTVEYEMFSTAGNGFTFELETAIFLAVALASTNCTYTSAPPDISVFGDDIILPSIYFNSFTKISKIFGWVINDRKSFCTGFFRESCGGDFYKGVNVRGYNAKNLPQTPSQWISFANAIKRVCYYNHNHTWRDDWCFHLWGRIVDNIPSAYQLFGPEHYGDVCINCEDSSRYVVRHHRRRGDQIKTLQQSGGVFTSVENEIRKYRTSGYDAERLVQHVSLVGHGRRFITTKDGARKFSSPSSLLVSSDGNCYEIRWIPYTLYGAAPADLDELWSFLYGHGFENLRDPNQVVVRHTYKLHSARRQLAAALRRVVELRNVRQTEDFSMFFSF